MLTAHNTDYTVAFYNDRVKEVIDPGIIAEPFTYVPIKAGHMELIGGNALVFGKTTEGYDVIDISMSTELTYEDVSLENPIVNLAVDNTLLLVEMTYFNMGEDGFVSPTPVSKENWDGTQSWRKLSGTIEITLPSLIIEGAEYNISIRNDAEGIVSTTSTYTAAPGDVLADVKAGLIAALTADGFGAEIQAGLWGANKIFIFAEHDSFMEVPTLQAGDIDTVFKDYIVSAYVLQVGHTVTFPQLKCGAVHEFGIVYKDRSNRTCSVIKSKNLSKYIPFYTEEVESADNYIHSINNLVFKIYHKPPVWAESYEIVYFGNISMDYFLQIRVASITPLTYGVDRFSMNIQETLEWTWNHNNRWRVSEYTWQAGDRVRFMGTIDAGSGVVTKYAALYDYEIDKTAETSYGEAIGGDFLTFQATDRPATFAGATNILAEIYRPRKGIGLAGDVGAAYGTGMVFPIATDDYGNKYHKGSIDQVIDSDGECIVEAEVDNTAQDCWKFLRLNYKFETEDIQPFWAESVFPSDWWDNQSMSKRLTSAGFPFLDDLSQRQTILDERVRNGGFIITGTRTNNIAHFVYDDFMDLPKKNGDITGLREIGFTLKVIQQYKETSIYINRRQTFNPDGTEQFVLTDKFLAEQRPMETDYGCQHPDSVMVNGRNLYYWDNSQGVFIRSSPNGQVSLSDPKFKMSRWFKDAVSWIRTTGGSEVLVANIGANNEFDEVWITFRMGTEVRGLIFSEKRGRYVSEIDQITESYLHLGNFFAHLYHQRLWIMNVDEGQGYLSWSGTDTYAELEIVGNMEPTKNKIFNAVALVADHPMDSLSREVYIPIEASACGELMESNIPLWDRREGIYFGKIMKDENSKGSFVSTYDRKNNGRALRGRYAFVKLYTDEHDEKVRIDSITVFSTLSERNI